MPFEVMSFDIMTNEVPPKIDLLRAQKFSPNGIVLKHYLIMTFNWYKFEENKINTLTGINF